AVNSMLCNTYGERRLLVNTVKCPKFTKGLERQIYDKNGEPEKDKGGKKSKKMFDHGNDAGGYPIAHLFPVKQRIYDLNMDTTF
ncbi:terminase, partial [Salmonella enterica subsp. enterica serovar Mikawasima]|nr:terminase [Salmonella enterica subsp. enterica serovar Mikawasima]